MAIFQDNLNLGKLVPIFSTLDISGAKDDEGSGGNWSYKTCAKLQSNRHHQQTITQIVIGRMPFLSPNQQCQSTEGKQDIKQHWQELSRTSHT